MILDLAVVAEVCPDYFSWDWAEVNWHIINCAYHLIISNKAKEWPVMLDVFIIYHFTLLLLKLNADFGFWLLWKAAYLILSYDTFVLVPSWRKLFTWTLNFCDLLKTWRDITFILCMFSYFRPTCCRSAVFFKKIFQSEIKICVAKITLSFRVFNKEFFSKFCPPTCSVPNSCSLCF